MKTLTIKNFQISAFAKALTYPMPFNKSRIRNRFIRLLKEKLDLVEKSRIEIIEGLCKRDDDGKPIMNGPVYTFTDENTKKINEEYEKLMNEECVIDIAPSMETEIGEIKAMFHNSPVELETDESVQCEDVFKALTEMTEKKNAVQNPKGRGKVQNNKKS